MEQNTENTGKNTGSKKLIELVFPIEIDKGTRRSYTPKAVKMIVEKYKNAEELDKTEAELMELLKSKGFDGAGIISVTEGEHTELVEFDN